MGKLADAIVKRIQAFAHTGIPVPDNYERVAELTEEKMEQFQSLTGDTPDEQEALAMQKVAASEAEAEATVEQARQDAEHEGVITRQQQRRETERRRIIAERYAETPPSRLVIPPSQQR